MMSNAISNTDNTMFNAFPDLCTIPEMCQMLRIGRTSADGLLSSGEIPSRLILGKRAIPKAAIVQWYLRQEKTGYFPEPPANYTYFDFKTKGW